MKLLKLSASIYKLSSTLRIAPLRALREELLHVNALAPQPTRASRMKISVAVPLFSLAYIAIVRSLP
jgi:hypothetical protein